MRNPLGNTYNSIGQLIKSVSGSSATTYSYDIRGAVSSLQNSAVNQSITRNANGTISKIIDNGIAHTFEYDKVGRLLSETCDNSTSTTGIFSSAYTYDRNSNITTLTRKGYPAGMSYPSYPVDDLTMTYDGNRLIKVTDNAGEVLLEKTFDFHDGANNSAEYTYDSNGNVTRDDNRGLTDITYNAINLPSHIEVGSDAASEAIVDYIYDAAGNKLGTRSLISYFSTRPLTTYAIQQPCRAENHDYIGSYEFRNGQLHRVNTPYGYITMGTFIPYRRDYQGNNRNNADYYAYGLPVQGSNVSDQDPYLYGGKEFYSVKGINIYDFNARTYAPDIARFMQPDPKAGDYHWLSPYTFCGGDPINRVDEDGKDWNIEKEHTEEGLLIKLSITGVVYNSSTKKIDLNQVATTIAKQIEDIFNITYNKVKVSMKTNIRVASSVDEIKNTDHVFEIVDHISDKYPNAPAKVNDIPGLGIKIKSDFIDDIEAGNNIRTISHEVGHTGGLRHIDTASDKDSNLMTQWRDLSPGVNVNTAKHLQLRQIETITNNYYSGKLNNHSPLKEREKITINTTYPFIFTTKEKYLE